MRRRLLFGLLVAFLPLCACGWPTPIATPTLLATPGPQTVSGVVITLKRVELSTTGAKVYALAQPPDWNPPAPTPSPAVPMPIPTPPHQMYPVPAQYSLDGGPMRDAGSAGFNWLQEGIGLTWDLIDPVPNGTEELTIFINQFGQWSGPWKFHIPLQ